MFLTRFELSNNHPNTQAVSTGKRKEGKKVNNCGTTYKNMLSLPQQQTVAVIVVPHSTSDTGHTKYPMQVEFFSFLNCSFKVL